MTPERFAQLRHLVLQVIELPAEKRRAYLDEACGGDPELRGEVESLLAHFDESDESMEMLAADSGAVSGSLAATPSAAAPHPTASFGRYRNLRPCGEGGMGVVYRAEDTKLQRAVALKFLRPDFASGGDTQARFIQEARAAAALDHPNICTIYEVEEVEGQTFISMAYVKGETLRDHLSAGPMSIDDTLLIGLQIASGLREAHERGIVHRDIKPTNLMLSSSGFIKIMDFGIASFVERSGVTETGVPVGTVGYMSPEQTRGQSVDDRTDIWSLGVVLFEMLVGKLPFEGASVHAVGDDSGQGRDQGIGRVRRGVPPALEALIRRCLERNPAQRPDAGEVVAELEAIRQQTRTTEMEAGAEAGRRHRGRWILAAAGLVVLFALAATSSWRGARQGAPTRPPEQHVRRLTALHQERLWMGGSALSPDGRYVAVPHHGILDVFSVDTGEKRRIAAAYPGRIRRVTWAPDGETILCSTGRRLWFQRVFGDSSRLVLDGETNQIALSPDGRQIALIRSAHTLISIVNASGGDTRVIQRASPGQSFFSLAWSPSGRRIAYLRVVEHMDRVRATSLESCDLEGRRVPIIEDDCCLDHGDVWGSLCWLSDERLVFGRFTDPSNQTSALQSIAVDASTGLPDGRPESFLALEGMRLRQPTASADGRRVSFHHEQVVDQLLSLRLDAAGDSIGIERLSSNRWPSTVGTWTRDGRSVFFASANANGDANIAVRQLERGADRPFVNTPLSEEPQCLTPDGTQLIFRQGEVFKRKSLDGGPEVAIVRGDREDRVMCAVAPGSLCVLCSVEPAAQHSEVVFRRLGVATGQVGEEIGRATVDTNRPLGFDYDLSPDGTRVAIAEQTGRLRILDLRDGAERELRSDLGRPQFVAWSGDARWLCVSGMYGVAPYWLKRVPLDGGSPRLLWTSDDAWASSPRPSPDGSRVAFTEQGWQTDVWLLENP